MLKLRDQMSPPARARCLRGLVEICGKYDILTDSYTIPEPKIRKLGDFPIYSDSFSEVWQGMHGEDKFITVKSIRYRKGNIQEIKKVGWFDLFPQPQLSPVVCRTFSERP